MPRAISPDRVELLQFYTGDFQWLGKRQRGSHTPLVTHQTFDHAKRSSVAGDAPAPGYARAPLHGDMPSWDC